MTDTNQKLREALRRIKHESASLADAQVIALEALSLPTQAGAVDVPTDGWLQDGGLLYRLTDDRNPKNRDEIYVTMADGSRSDASRTRRAGELLDRIRSIKAEPVEGGEVDQARFDAGCDVLKYLRQEGAPPRITNLMLVCLHGDPERTAAIRARKDNT